MRSRNRRLEPIPPRRAAAAVALLLVPAVVARLEGIEGPERVVRLGVLRLGDERPAGAPVGSGAEALPPNGLVRGARRALASTSDTLGPTRVELVVADTARAGAWGAGASELVRLAYEEHVIAVIGELDARAAHVAEQVVARAKGRLVFLSTGATDASLTRIRVPWFLRLVPDDLAQADAILDDLATRHGSPAVRLLVDPVDADSRIAADAFERAAARRAGVRVERLDLQRAELEGLPGEDPRGEPARDGAALRPLESSPGAAIVLLTRPRVAGELARRVREASATAPIYGHLRIAKDGLDEFLGSAGDAAEGVVLAAPAPAPSGWGEEVRPPRGSRRDRGTDVDAAFGHGADVDAAYGHDAALVLIDALRRATDASGPALRDALATTDVQGLTGRIRFDENGNRKGAAPLSRIRRGRLAPLDGDRPPAREPPRRRDHPLRKGSTP